jgi:hypothetical protein
MSGRLLPARSRPRSGEFFGVDEPEFHPCVDAVAMMFHNALVHDIFPAAV